MNFRLNEFKAVAKWLEDNLPLPLAFFLRGWLWALEERWIDAKVQSTIEKALTPHKPSQPRLRPPKRHTSPSEVEGLDIIQISTNYNEQ